MMTRTLHFERDMDKSGVSGPGRVALAVEWPDGSYNTWWYPAVSDRQGTHGWMPDAGELFRVHGHQGATRFVYDDTGEELAYPPLIAASGWSAPTKVHLLDVKQGWDFPKDLLKAAWGLIANANEGDWDDAAPGWKEAAVKWRDAYHETLAEPEDSDRIPKPPRGGSGVTSPEESVMQYTGQDFPARRGTPVYADELVIGDGYVGPLTDEQRARIDALQAARQVLAAKGFASSGAVDANSLVAIAGWIVGGQDPWPAAGDADEL